jgi:hypothetical protein
MHTSRQAVEIESEQGRGTRVTLRWAAENLLQ